MAATLLSMLKHWWNRLSAASGGAAPSGYAPSSPKARPILIEDQLVERRTIDSLEREYTRRIEDLDKHDRSAPDRVAALVKPFGYSNGKWEALKAGMQPGDELWTFMSPSSSWQALAGRAGIAVVRDGTVIATLLTMMN
jgi:hypothetical protein